MRSSAEFTASPSQLRAMYEHGWGIAEIMYRTGKAYIEVISKLSEAGTKLITGGPHDTSDCVRHDHALAVAHENGATCCVCTAKPRSRRQARLMKGGVYA